MRTRASSAAWGDARAGCLRRLVGVAGVCLLALGQTGCWDPFYRGPRGGSGGGGSGGVSFAQDVYPVLVSRCMSCHSDAGTAASSALVLTSSASDDYDVVRSLVTPREPAKSALLLKASGKTAHGGGAILSESSAGYAKLKAWIEAGAPGGAGPKAGAKTTQRQ